MRRGAARAVVATVLVAGLAGRSAADPRIEAEAERRNRAANKLYQQGRYESALQIYQSAYDLSPKPKYLFNIGLAREKTFDYEGCTIALQEFLRATEEDGEPQIRETAQKRRDACLARTQITVRFTSVPTNAAIYVREGGEKVLRGRTPQELPLDPGEHHVTVELRGYVPQDQTISVEVGKRPQADFVLEKLSSLRIEVDPSGSRVKIDDFPWEGAPVTRQVRAGVHQVVVEKEGYAVSRREVKVESGQEVSLVLSLRPLPRIRQLAVRASDGAGGALVSIDGEPVGRAPVERELSPGEYRVELSAPGHIPFADTIRVPEDRDLLLEVDMKPVRSRRDRIIFWSALGAGGFAAAVGSVYGVLALVDQARFDDDPTNVMLHERGEDRAFKADLWLGAAAVVTGGAFAYYWFTRPGESRARAAFR